MTNSCLNVALVGYGYAGRTFHAPLIMSTPGLRLATVVSSEPAKVLQHLPDVKVETDVGDVLSDPDIELVVIATPNSTHFTMAAQALQSGKNVVVDKPLATTSKEAAELIRISNSQQRLFSVFQNRRWDADFLTLQGVVATHSLGELIYLQSDFNRFRPTLQHRWREQAVPGGGLWFDLGSHLVDQAVVLFGAPDTVTADLESQRDGATAVDYFHVVLVYGKKRVILHASSLVLGDWPRFVAHGTKGSYIKHGLDTQEQSLKNGASPGSQGWGQDPNAGILYTRDGDSTQAQQIPNLAGNYVVYYEAIRDAIQSAKPNPVSAAEALMVMSLLELAVESARQRKTLEFKPALEVVTAE